VKRSYGQFCPVAKASEILAERWTPLVVRELLAGSERFNDLRRGVPLISPALLSQRLKRLEDEDLVIRHVDGEATRYRLTDAGQELMPVIEALGTWGKRWLGREADADDLDAGLLMWDIHRRLHIDRFPSRRTVLKFDLQDVPSASRFYWLVIECGRVDICLKDPGHPVDLGIEVDLRTMTDVWLGDLAMAEAVRTGKLKLTGPSNIVRRFRSWLKLSVFADIEREDAA
jgi:DNA-binding HxlR family transcriptional regulator